MNSPLNDDLLLSEEDEDDYLSPFEEDEDGAIISKYNNKIPHLSTF